MRRGIMGVLALITAIGLVAPVGALAASGWSPTATIEGGIHPSSVSCPTASFCASVDVNGGAETFNGTSWSAPAAIDPGNDLVFVSCTSASFCVTVDKKGALTFDGSSWSAPVSVVTNAQLQAVSCAAVTFCMVTAYGRVFTYEGGGWSESAFIDTAPAGENRFYAYTLTSISCPSTSFCTTVDGWGKALTYRDGVWSAPVRIDGETRLTSVSCVSATFCAATDREGSVFIYDGSSWSAPAHIDPGSELTSVSCPSASFCVAVDWGGRVFTYDGSSWTGPLTIDPGHMFTSVSCSSTLSCIAVDSNGNVFSYRADPPSPAAGDSLPTVSAHLGRKRATTNAHVGRAGVRGQVATVPLKCTGRGGARCKITVVIRAGEDPTRRLTVARKTVRLETGHSRVVQIKLNAVGKRLLHAHQRLAARLEVIQGQSNGTAVISSQPVSFGSTARP